MDIGPYVALIVLLIGTPYMAYKKQWVLAGCFLVIAAAIVARTFFGAAEFASALTWASLVLLAIGVYQLLRHRKSSQPIS